MRVRVSVRVRVRVRARARAKARAKARVELRVRVRVRVSLTCERHASRGRDAPASGSRAAPASGSGPPGTARATAWESGSVTSGSLRRAERRVVLGGADGSHACGVSRSVPA